MTDVDFVLQQVAFRLVERPVNTTVPAPIATGSQVVALTDSSLYIGAQIIVGNRGAVNQEVVTITAMTNTGFTATFANTHATGETIRGATFPSGQIPQDLIASLAAGATVAPLFTQAEMLGYFKDVQNDYLEETRMIYAVATVGLTANIASASTPSDSIRVERVDIAGVALWPVSQAELDMNDAAWSGNTGIPNQWYQDRLNTSKFGVQPPPGVAQNAELFYSQKGTSTPVLTDALIVPDIFFPYLVWGILGKALSKDGETKDPRRAQYAQKRYLRGVAYGVKFSMAMQAVMQQAK